MPGENHTLTSNRKIVITKLQAHVKVIANDGLW